MSQQYYSITNFSISPRWMWFVFQFHGVMVTLQLKKTPGLVNYQIWTKGFTNYYTLTCWESREAMLEFRNKRAHLKAMKGHRKLGRSKSAGWYSTYEPYKEECYDHLYQKYSAQVSH